MTPDFVNGAMSDVNLPRCHLESGDPGAECDNMLQSVKHSDLPIPVTISHVSSIAFTGVIFGPALVGFSAETFGLTFNMYLLGIIMFAISVLMLFIMQNDDQDKNIKSDII